MSGRIEDGYVRGDAAVTSYGDPFASREDAVMSEACVIANLQGGPRAKLCCEMEAGFAVEGNVVADDQVAFPLHPMQKNPGVQVASMAAAVGFEKRLANEYPVDEVPGVAKAKHGKQKRSEQEARRRHAQIQKP